MCHENLGIWLIQSESMYSSWKDDKEDKIDIVILRQMFLQFYLGEQVK